MILRTENMMQRCIRPDDARGAAGRNDPHAGPLLAAFDKFARAFHRMARGFKPTVRREVERRLEPLLAGEDIRIERIARDLGCSRQTLYRRLKAEGVSYEALVDGVRRQIAIRLVQRDGLAVKQAAFRTGFSDPAAFSRAFKRGAGESPTAAPARAQYSRH